VGRDAEAQREENGLLHTRGDDFSISGGEEKISSDGEKKKREREEEERN
jgi:hypothetical protein